MPHSARTASGVGSARSPQRIAALPAVLLLAVLAALGIAAPAPGTAGAWVSAAPAATAPQRYDETRAGDGCDAVRAVRAAIRHEQHSEHPGTRGHLGVCGRRADVTPGRVPGPPQAPSRHLPCSQPLTDQEQGRAPPVSSGT
ncbi:hypothetical protein [Streptomyces sp. SID5643]|uniref:hypothetical protein n=1 Tax=Streptomyces sp. SID5643 TaxID=2690307 RepID=UPI0013700E9E|nr:hypothetical protein [Streptomyces sp. SID5643]MZF86377.1 hypothetical protein [Streptomyces sp. SID5643]